MNRKSCSKMPRLQKTISPIVLASAIAAIAILWCPRPAKADNAPDWLRIAAHEKLPAYQNDPVAVVLLDDEQVVVKDDGEVEVRIRRAYKLLRPESRERYGYASAHCDNETKISSFKAWTITADGKEFGLKEKDAGETGLSADALYSDVRVKYLRFPEANPGNVVGYEVIQKQRPYVFDDVWDFQYTVPVHESRFALQLPAGWEFSTFWSNHAEEKPQTPGPNQYMWEITESPAIEVEPEMPAWESIAGRMGVKYFPRDPAMRKKTTGSWKDIGLWYNGLTASSRTPTPAIQQKVAQLTAGMSGPLEKMKALAAFVQRDIRYAAIEIGIGGFRPHAAADIFTNAYGDCKDKATLLSTMLKEIGIDSYYVVIDTERGVVQPNFPSMDFNHAILAIRLPDTVPDAALYAILKDPKLGRLLFFDPTNSHVPLGYVPAYLQDTYALLATPDGGELVSVPLLPASTNRLIRTAQLELSSTGNLSGEVRELRWGAPATSSRDQLLTTEPAKRGKVFEDFLGNSLTAFTLMGASVGNLEQYDQSLTLDYKFFARGYAKSAGDLLVVRPRVLGQKGSDILSGKPRKYSIEFPDATRQDDDFEITLPAGYVVDELPQPVKAECPYGSYQSHVEVSGNTLTYKRTYQINDIIVPTEKLGEVRGFFQQIASDERSSAILRKTSP